MQQVKCAKRNCEKKKTENKKNRRKKVFHYADIEKVHTHIRRERERGERDDNGPLSPGTVIQTALRVEWLNE